MTDGASEGDRPQADASREGIAPGLATTPAPEAAAPDARGVDDASASDEAPTPTTELPEGPAAPLAPDSPPEAPPLLRSPEPRGVKLDPSRPLRMPGASLREPERPSIQLLRRLLAAAGARVESWRSKSGPVETSKLGEGGGQRVESPPAGVAAVFAHLSKRPRLLAAAGAAALTVALIVALVVRGRDEEEHATETSTAAAVVGPGPAAPILSELADGGGELGPRASVPQVETPPKIPVFRVKSMADAEVEIVEGAVGKRPLLAALAGAGLSNKDSFRALHAFKGKQFDRPQPTDSFVLARRRNGGRLVGFEYITQPFDVWQARENDEGKLEGKKVEFTPEFHRITRALLVGDDLRKSFAQAELDDDLIAMLDDALEGHAELADVRPGARLRLVVEEERIEGAFAGYSQIDAVEYVPANAKAHPIRVYRFDRYHPNGVADRHGASSGTASGSAVKKNKANFFFDERARQPYKGGFRSPVPFARITSRFNPKRMHPVLHIVTPHNGIDYGAPIGTPIYATASGVVRVAGMVGPNGNMVQVYHPNGLTSAYCHMSRFAAGLHPGQHVESRQLLGYVGQTGRSTGPHLHFAIKRGEMFLDPMSLKLDGVRTLPAADRDAFDHARAELDAALESTALPPPLDGAGAASTASSDSEDAIYDDLTDAGASSASGSGAAADATDGGRSATAPTANSSSDASP